MAISLHQLVRFLPRRVLRHCANHTSDSLAPFEERARGAVLFADIAGFTDLSERLAGKLPFGLEELTEALNAFFRPLIDIIIRNGGDVIKMAGDAVVVEWEARPADALGETVMRAVRCAREIQWRCGGSTAERGAGMSLSIGIGAGESRFLYVGGKMNRWELLPLGEPFFQMGAARDAARPGDVVVSPEAWKLTEGRVPGQAVAGGCVRITGGAGADAGEGPDVLSPAAEVNMDELDPRVAECFAPQAVRHLFHGADQSWLAELRPVTVLFIIFPPQGEVRTALESVQSLMELLQEGLYRYGGAVNKWVGDDKGMSLLAVFGLPPTSHEDDPHRGVLAAMELREKFATAGWRASCGVATGRAFCGPNTDAARQEYTILGTVVNLAARLAQFSEGRVLCDGATFQATAARVRYTALPPFRFKGIPRSVTVFEPSGPAPRVAEGVGMVGRAGVFSRLRSAAGALAEGKCFLGVIEGDAGIGKSTLVSAWIKDLAQSGVRVLEGAGEAIHATTPYFAWRGILQSLLHLSAAQDVDRVLEQCRGIGRERSAPLLNDVLNLGIPESDLTRQMSGRIRADNTRDLVVALVAAEAEQGPLCLVLEDCHWMDSASLALAAAVAAVEGPLLMVCTIRRMTGARGPALAGLCELPRAERIYLSPWSRRK